MIGLLFATDIEARATIDRLGGLLRRHDQTSDAGKDSWFEKTYRFDGGVIVVSGMGGAAAEDATEYLLDVCGVMTVVNVGVCGALSADLQPGDLVRVAEVVGVGAIAAGPLDDFPAVRLASADSGLFGGERRDALAAKADIVDMEGSAIARVCRERGVEVCMLKGVTDLADSGGREHLQANIEPVSKQLADAIANVLIAHPHTNGFWTTLARFTRVEHSVFSLPLLLAGAYLGAGHAWPGGWTLVLIVVAGVSARALGMAANRILDRKLDALNPRTAGRELPSGRMSTPQALAVAGAPLLVYLAAAAALGPLCLKLSPIPAVCMILYPLGKRVTSLCHFGIGVCMALGPLGAFVAASGSLDLTAESLLLAAAAMGWISGFDIIYALQDIDADRAAGVRSLPSAIGARKAQIVAAMVHAATLAAAVALWILGGMTPAATALMLVAAGGFLLAYHPRIDPATRFFPISVISGMATAIIPILGKTP